MVRPIWPSNSSLGSSHADCTPRARKTSIGIWRSRSMNSTYSIAPPLQAASGVFGHDHEGKAQRLVGVVPVLVRHARRQVQQIPLVQLEPVISIRQIDMQLARGDENHLVAGMAAI